MATSGLGSHVRRLAGALSLRQLVVVWIEEVVGALLRPIPGFTGLTLRWLFFRTLFARLDGFCLIYAGSRISHTYGIRAGRNFGINSGVFLDGRGGLTFGDNVLIGPNSVILSSEHQWSDPSLPIIAQGNRLAPTTVGDDVWIGGNATVLPGVTIASGTVVGAGAVVTGDTEPYTIVGGVPARVIGRRARPDAAQGPAKADVG